MPHIVVKLWPGSSEELKTKYAQKIVKEGAEILGKGEDYFSVAFEEITPEDWAEKVYRPEIDKNLSKLYVKPGYKM